MRCYFVKRLFLLALSATILLTGCGKPEPEPVQEVVDPFEGIEVPVQPKAYMTMDVAPATIPIEPSDVKHKAKYQSVTVSGYIQYEDFVTIITETHEYYVKSLKVAKLMHACSSMGMPVMMRVSHKNKVIDWYTVIQNGWYAPKSMSEVVEMYKFILGDPSNDCYPLSVGDTGRLGGTLVGYTDGKLDININGEHKYVYANDDAYITGDFMEFDVKVITGGALATADYVVPEPEENAVPLDYQCPVGYSKIKPLEYKYVSDTSDVNTLSIKGGGQYTTDTWEVAELITLAYYSGIDVYIKTGDNLFQIEDYILVEDKQELDISTSEELMNHVNAKINRKPKPKTSKLTATLLTVTPSINLYSGVSDLDAIDRRPFYSYHYAVLQDSKYHTRIVRYTSGTKGIDYLNLYKHKNSKVKCKVTCFILTDENGKHTNYVLDEVK